MADFWKSTTKDKIQNGAVLGGLFGAAVAWGDKVSTYLAEKVVIPADWMYFNEWTMTVYLIGAGALIGYLVDKY